MFSNTNSDKTRVAAISSPKMDECPEPPILAASPIVSSESGTPDDPPKRLGASTSRAYAKDLRLFESWGGAIPTDESVLREYIFEMRDKVAPTTLYRRMMAVRHAHTASGHISPTEAPSFRLVLRALQQGYVLDKKLKDTSTESCLVKSKRRQTKSVSPITRRLLQKMLDHQDRTALDKRDRALLLLGFMAALNRTALLEIDVRRDLRFSPDALSIRLRAPSKDDEEKSDGNLNPRIQRQVVVPITGGALCAATSVRHLIEHLALDVQKDDGPLFRRFDRGGNATADRLSAAYANVIVKKRIFDIGMDPTTYSAHSLRRGRLLEIAKGVL